MSLLTYAKSNVRHFVHIIQIFSLVLITS